MRKMVLFLIFSHADFGSNFTIWKNVFNPTLYAFISAKKVTSRDIVDGHREKTLHLLWTIILKYQVGCCFLLISKLLILVECEEKKWNIIVELTCVPLGKRIIKYWTINILKFNENVHYIQNDTPPFHFTFLVNLHEILFTI